MRPLVLISSLIVLTGTGCTRREPPQAPAPPAADSAPVKAEGPSGEAERVDMRGPSIGDQLQAESAQRPREGARAEDLLEALRAVGLESLQARQHLGSPVGARYCLGVTLPDEVAFSVCEYADEAAAKAGQEFSAKAFAAVPHRLVQARKHLTLSLLAPPTPQAQSAAKKIRDAFQNL
jgi:hypothetical protein